MLFLEQGGDRILLIILHKSFQVQLPSNNHYDRNQFPLEYAFLESLRRSVLDRERDWFEVG